MGWHLPLLPALLLLLAAAGASAATSQSHATATSFIAASGSDEAEGYMPHSSLSGLLARAFPAAAAPSLNTLNTNATAAASARSKLRSTLDRCILDALAPHYSGLLLRAHELHQPGVVELLQDLLLLQPSPACNTTATNSQRTLLQAQQQQHSSANSSITADPEPRYAAPRPLPCPLSATASPTSLSEWAARVGDRIARLPPAMSYPVVRRLLAAVVVRAWLDGGGGPLGEEDERAVQHLFVQLYSLHRRGAAHKGIMEYMHVSKSGGTSWCHTAKINGCTTQRFDKYFVCGIKDFEDKVRWVDGVVHTHMTGAQPTRWALHGTFRSPSAPGCQGRAAALRSSRWTYYSNEYTMTGGEGSMEQVEVCSRQFVTALLIRHPLQRLRSHLRFILLHYKRFMEQQEQEQEGAGPEQGKGVAAQVAAKGHLGGVSGAVAAQLGAGAGADDDDDGAWARELLLRKQQQGQQVQQGQGQQVQQEQGQGQGQQGQHGQAAAGAAPGARRRDLQDAAAGAAAGTLEGGPAASSPSPAASRANRTQGLQGQGLGQAKDQGLFFSTYSRANASFWQAVAPAVTDNYNMRTLLGEAVWHAPVGSLTANTHLAAAALVLMQLDVVVPLEAPREASRLLLQFGAGWPKTLEDVHDKNMAELSAHFQFDPEPHLPPRRDLEALYGRQELDVRLYDTAVLLGQLDGLVYGTAAAAGAVPWPGMTGARWRRSIQCGLLRGPGAWGGRLGGEGGGRDEGNAEADEGA